jgi:type IV pilus assembly protein PilV
MLNMPDSHGRNRDGGFTLIEALVAVLVLSIGLLGLAGLQATSLRTNQDAYFRSQATILARSMMDELRAQRDDSLAGGFNTTLGESYTAGATDPVNAWLESLDQALPAGTGAVNVDPATRIATVTVRWTTRELVDDGEGGQAPVTQQFVWESRL